MSSEDSEIGKGATDEGWGDELTRTGHEDESGAGDEGETSTAMNPAVSEGREAAANDETPTPDPSDTPSEVGAEQANEATRSDATAPTDGGQILWEEFLGDNEVAEHATDLRDSIDEPDLVGGDVDLRPPMRRFLSSKANSLDGTEQLGIRVEPETQQAYEEVKRMVADNFDDDIKGAYLADAVIRVACLHSDEVCAMLGAYGFDFEFK